MDLPDFYRSKKQRWLGYILFKKGVCTFCLGGATVLTVQKLISRQSYCVIHVSDEKRTENE